MILGDLAGLGLFDALNFCEFTLACGTLHGRSPQVSGRLYVHEGRITFGEIEDDPAQPHPSASGIPAETWAAVLAAGTPRGAVASALIDRGVDPAAVRRFVTRRIEWTSARLAREPGLQVSATTEPGWFGHEMGHPISAVIEAARVINFGGDLVGDHTGDALIATVPADRPTVVLGGEQWDAIAELLGATTLAALRERLGNRRAVELVRFLQAGGLATVVAGRTDT